MSDFPMGPPASEPRNKLLQNSRQIVSVYHNHDSSLPEAVSCAAPLVVGLREPIRTVAGSAGGIAAELAG